MERLNRPLTDRDKQMLELYLIQAKRGITERPGLAIPLIVIGACAFIVYESWETSMVWVVIAGIVFCLTLGLYVFALMNFQDHFRKDVVKAEELLASGEVLVRRYTCTDALVFETEEDRRHIWALQVAPREVMVWPDYQYEYADILPSRTFDLIDDEKLVQILGKTISNAQDHFSPTFVSMSVVGNAAIDNLPDEQGEILNTTLDELLEKAKGWV